MWSQSVIGLGVPPVSMCGEGFVSTVKAHRKGPAFGVLAGADRVLHVGRDGLSQNHRSQHLCRPCSAGLALQNGAPELGWIAPLIRNERPLPRVYCFHTQWHDEQKEMLSTWYASRPVANGPGGFLSTPRALRPQLAATRTFTDSYFRVFWQCQPFLVFSGH